jgi:hypothetical protein
MGPYQQNTGLAHPGRSPEVHAYMQEVYADAFDRLRRFHIGSVRDDERRARDALNGGDSRGELLDP